MVKNVLLEIGTEEIPSSYIAPALEQMQKFVNDMLTEKMVGFGQIKTYATPRRLV